MTEQSALLTLLQVRLDRPTDRPRTAVVKQLRVRTANDRSIVNADVKWCSDRLESKCLFMKEVKFDYLDMCNVFCYWCDNFALKILVVLIFSIAINEVTR